MFNLFDSPAAAILKSVCENNRATLKRIKLRTTELELVILFNTFWLNVTHRLKIQKLFIGVFTSKE